MRTALYALFVTVGFVLLIACANIGNLMLARADSRQREIAVRASLGASKWRIVRQLLTESFVISAAGGVAGVLLARAGIDALIAANPTTIPRMDQVRLDVPVLTFVSILVAGSALLFGLFPALRLLRADLQSAIREGAPSVGGGWGGRLRNALVVTEIALAVIVLIGAGLTIRSFQRVARIDAGFEAANIVTANIALPNSGYPSPATWMAFYRQFLDRLRAIPGTDAVAVSSGLPLNGGGAESGILPEGREMPKPGEHGTGCTFFTVSADYFKVLGVQLVIGRSFTDQDGADSTPVAVVDEKLANTFWPNADPIGKRVAFEIEGFNRADAKPIWREVVGVVRTVKHYGLVVESPRLQIYTPYTQIPLYFRESRPSMTLAVHTVTPPETVIAQVRKEVASIDKDIPVFGISTMQAIMDNQLESRRLPLWLMTLFSTLALTLAVIGIYGVMSYSVALRTHEIGIRIALGAQRADILRMVVRRGGMLIGFGLAIGGAGAIALTRLIKDMLYQTSPTDPATLAGVAIILSGVALLASYIPARRATRVDPLAALRYE